MRESNKNDDPGDEIDPIGEPYEGSITRLPGVDLAELEARGRLPPSAVASFWAGVELDDMTLDTDPWSLGTQSLLKLRD